MGDDVHDLMGWAFAEISNEYHEDIVSLSTCVEKEFNRLTGINSRIEGGYPCPSDDSIVNYNIAG